MLKNNVGIDIGGTKMLMLAKYNNDYIEKEVKTGINATKEYILKEINEFLNSLPFKVKQIGVALPGLVSSDDTLIISDVLPNLNGLKAFEVSNNNKYKVKFINDVKAATLSEAKNYPNKSVAVVMVGTGIALGFYDKDKLFTGSKGYAGEVGYAFVPYKDGVEKFDNLSSGRVILEKTKLTANELVKKLDENSERELKIVKEAGHYFGVLLGLITQFYNPDVIVVGGGTKTYKGYMDQALKTLKISTLEQSYETLSVNEPKDLKRIVANWGLLYDMS